MTDGAIRDAQFNKPQGLAYDAENKVFYVADNENRRLRKITMPK
ncbi:MAG: hypothetical protein LIP01_15735 [Tannerellaceae bacterium]|nr:hypothetical protein [Tannerellaceae bacterium]